MIAIWMCSTIARRSDSEVGTVLKRTRREIQSATLEFEEKITKLEHRIHELELLSSDAGMERSKNALALGSMEAELIALQREFDTLDGSIPQQYRNPARRQSGSPALG